MTSFKLLHSSVFLFLVIVVITCFKQFLSSASILKKELPPNFSSSSSSSSFLSNEFKDLSSFSFDLVKTLSVHLKKIPLPLLKQKVKTQIERAAKNLDLPNPEAENCEINYSELCPFQWVNAGDGESCLSPYDYSGPCKKKKVSFKNATSLIKQKFASDCNVSWPCINNCIRDYTQKCPEGWQLNSWSSLCEAPSTYDGKCIKQKGFELYTNSEKKIWEKECDVYWPCSEQKYDFHFLCPINWIQNPDEKSCTSPDFYIGPCSTILYVSDLTKNEKKYLMYKCNIQWPTYQNKKVYDFKKYVCPLGWKVLNIQQESCTAPISYNGPCHKNISFLNFSNEEKYEFSKKCDVQWNTLDQNFQNYDLSCPYNWKYIDEKKENICIAPKEYDGPCDNIVSFKNYTKEMKAAWANACETIFSLGELGDLQQGNGQKRNKKRKNLKIFGKQNVENVEVSPSINNGPIGYKGTVYEGEVLNADDETVYTPYTNISSYKNRQDKHNENNLYNNNNNNKTIQIENIGSRNNTDFIITDDKIKDLMLLKAASDDEQFRATVEETIQELKKKMHETDFSFIQLGTYTDKNVAAGKLDKKLDKELDEKLDNKLDKELDEKLDNKLDKNLDKKLDKKLYDHVTDTDSRTEEAKKISNSIHTDRLEDLKNLYENYKIENDNFLSNEDICLEKDYTKCPLGWSRINNKECLAPKSYIRNINKCPSILNIKEIVKNVYSVYHDMSFVTIDMEKMKQLEKVCTIQFPCKECEQDYVKINCPLGWKELPNKNCQAPIDYPNTLKKKCGTVVNFTFATPLFKKNWSFLCKSRWPCVSACEKNYSAICPVGYSLINKRKEQNGKEEIEIYVCTRNNWVQDEASILSDKSYEHNKNYEQYKNYEQKIKNNLNLCKVIELFDSAVLKKEIEKTCKVIWPCLNKCEEDFYQTCPYNWILKENKCISPYYYKPPKGCSNFFEVLSFSSLDKSIISNKCFAPWPCKNFCQQDYTGHCPNGWTLQKMVTKIKDKEQDKEQDTEQDIVQDETFFAEKKYTTKRKNQTKKKILYKYFCVAPHNYNGACHPQQDFTDFTFMQKQDFAFRCSVRWPCGQNVYNTENWQKENIYKDMNFEKLKTLRFYDTAYAEAYRKNRDSFFSFY